MNSKKRNTFIFIVGTIFFTIAFMLNDTRFFVGNGTDQKNKPPIGNANYAWIQQFLYHLSPSGQSGLFWQKEH